MARYARRAVVALAHRTLTALTRPCGGAVDARAVSSAPIVAIPLGGTPPASAALAAAIEW